MNRDRRLTLVLWTVGGVAPILVGIVLVLGNQSDRFGLASALASGLVVAAAVAAWERSRRREERRRVDAQQAEDERALEQKRRAIQRTLTKFIGGELSNIATEVQVVGVDEAGNTVELFSDINQALRAFENHRGVERIMRQVGIVSVRDGYPPQSLVLNAWDCVDRFYFWFAAQFEIMLTFFIESGEDRIVDALLVLRRIEYSHRTVGALLWKENSPKGWLQNMTDNRAQWASYVTQVVMHVLLRYAELLRAIEGVQPGIAQTPSIEEEE